VWRSCGRGVVAGGAVASAHGHGGVRCNGSARLSALAMIEGGRGERKWKTRQGSGFLLSQACKHDAVESYTRLGETRGGRTLASVGHSSTEETESISKVVTDS
jgi:hypothetical protein